MARHYRCPICDTGRLLSVEVDASESVSSCTNDDCSTNQPTTTLPSVPSVAEITDRHRALATQEVRQIRDEMTERHRRGEWR